MQTSTQLYGATLRLCLAAVIIMSIFACGNTSYIEKKRIEFKYYSELQLITVIIAKDHHLPIIERLIALDILEDLGVSHESKLELAINLSAIREDGTRDSIQYNELNPLDLVEPLDEFFLIHEFIHRILDTDTEHSVFLVALPLLKIHNQG